MKSLTFGMLVVFMSVISTAANEENEFLSRTKRQQSPQKRSINIENIRSTSVQIGFRFVNDAKSYVTSAFEYSNGRITQTVPTNRVIVDEHSRQAVVPGLVPGREYLIVVQGRNRQNRLLPTVSEGVVNTALRCYVCNGQASNAQCRGRSTARECPRGTDACLNEMRFHNGIPTITKRCAQFRPELATVIRGGSDATQACKGTVRRDATCQCNCKSDLCNADELPCETRCFPPLQDPQFGSLQCNNGNKGGSQCRWTCDSGRQLRGTDRSICKKDGTWSVVTPPQCIKQVVRPMERNPTEVFLCPELNQPENGRISCTKVNQPGSVCSYSCNEDHQLAGASSRRTCTQSGSWTGTPITCQTIRCPAVESIPGGDFTCTNANQLRSVCEFSCDEKYSLIGTSSATCLKTARWSEEIPTCERRGCFLRPRVGSNVLSECEDFTEPEEGAECQYSCHEGFMIEGSASLRCVNNRWSGQVPTCSRIQCRPSLRQPRDGFLRCTNQQFTGSTCTFSCGSRFILVGQRTLECLNAGRWSSQAPICKRVTCQPIVQYRNGFVTCTNSNQEGSRCSFSCADRYGLVSRASKRITCQAPLGVVPAGTEHAGQWSRPVPACELSRCPARETNQAVIRSCSENDYRLVGSICRHWCQPGYRLNGRGEVTCRKNRFGFSLGAWSSINPVCIRIQCPSQGRIANGRFQCSNERFPNSVCTLECHRGYQVDPDKESIRCNSNGKWDRSPSTCRRVVCNPATQIVSRNFVFHCGAPQRLRSGVRGYFVDYECPVSCRIGFTLNQEYSASCSPTGTWIVPDEAVCDDNNECEDENGNCEQICTNTPGSYSCSCRENSRLAPNGKTCILLGCRPLEESDNQNVVCNNGWRIGSQCNISCDDGYELQEGSSNLTCEDGGSWNRQQPTCRRVQCATLQTPVNGNLSCSDGNMYQSVCTSVCNNGFELMGFQTSECLYTQIWSHSASRCRRIQCAEENTFIVNGRTNCTDANFYLSNCTYSCSDGYHPVSSINEDFQEESFSLTSQCLQNTLWSSPAPNCVKKECSPTVEEMYQNRSNSNITCTDGNLYESTCSISCQPGYQLRGSRRTTCTELETWSGSLGQCEKIQCSEYEPLDNGIITCSDENYFGSHCSFVCDEGYNLTGVSMTTCQADRTWGGRMPRCQIVQCNETQTYLPNGSVNCTNAHFYNSRCTLRCQPGYEFKLMSGNERARKNETNRTAINEVTDNSSNIISSRCLASGNWSDEKPDCVKQRCYPDVAIFDEREMNGRVECTDGELFMSQCQLICNDGFEVMEDRETTQCLETRRWTTELGRCKRIQCQAFEDLDNGEVICTEENLFESTCSFQCVDGYELVGENSSSCQSTRTFSNPKPTCQKIECSRNFTVLENGNATCTDGFKFDSRCVYSCNPGYEMNGTLSTNITRDTAILTCMADRTWRGDLPICIRKQCSRRDGALARAALNGNVTCTEEVFFQSACTVDCHIGYELLGNASTRCTASADWEPVIGNCQKITCPPLEAPENGVVTCTDENRFESVCTSRCNSGFERIGLAESMCQSNGTFTNQPSSCREILCPLSHTSIANGTANCTNSNKFGSRCLYSCDPGYELTATSTTSATCQSNDTWNTNEVSTCAKIRCSETDPILTTALENGIIQCSDENRFQSVCSLTCNEGYELTDQSSITECLANQTWRNGFGNCQKIRCTAVDKLENGAAVCSDENRYQSKCQFTCNNGYNLTGSEETVCQSNQEFTNSTPLCQKTQCSDTHLEVGNGTAVCTETNFFESICEYQCDPGYELTSGSNRSRCEADQTWTQEKATCERKICPADNEFLTQAEINGQITCTSGRYFESVCSVVCDEGYSLMSGESNATRCGEDGDWDANIGRCTKIRCPEFDILDNRIINCSDENRYLSACDFNCIVGYELEGQSSSVCQANQTWSNPDPLCRRTQCAIDYLALDHGSSSCTIMNQFESVCTYTCEPGYQLAEASDTSVQCFENQTWSKPKPTCSKIGCPSADSSMTRAAVNGTVDCSDENLFESVCSLSCSRGQEVVGGEQQVTCLDTAQWSSNMGICERVSCEVLTAPENGVMTCTEMFRYGSFCGFYCHTGYRLVGLPETLCLANKRFTSLEPICTKKNCSSDHLSIQFGSANCTEGNLFESVCTYKCNDGFQFLDGDFTDQDIVTSKCLADQEWDIDAPICEKKTCPVEKDENFSAALNMGVAGSVSCTEGNRFGSVCTLHCSIGHEPEGAASVRCDDEGRWNISIGTCKMIECPPRSPPVFGDISCTDEFNFDTHCQLSCDEGHQFNEETIGIARDESTDATIQTIEVLCTQEREWNMRDTPVCEKIRCPMEPWNSIDNGKVNCNEGNVYQSTCFYQCDPGYELVNPADSIDITSVLTTCTRMGLWDLPEVPRCSMSLCSPSAFQLQKVEKHGVITCNNGSDYQSRCDLSCNRGYYLRNMVNSTVCERNGRWTNELDACEKIECPVLSTPINARVTCSDDYFFKSHCSVTCNEGYTLDDPEEEYDVERGILCRSDRSWCGEFPPCIKIRCPRDHLRIERGSIRCTNSNLFGSICSYSCNSGYHMIQGQSDISACGSNGLWSGDVPTCEGNRCSANDSSQREADIALHGSVSCTDENIIGSHCSLNCPNGYKMTGENSTTCKEDLTWSNGLGMCKKITCGTPEIPPNTALLCSDDYSYESNCAFACLPGYRRIEELSGNLAHDLICDADGSWTGNIRNCQKLTCPIYGFEIVENGRVRCSDANHYASECLFSCEPGFELVDRFDRPVSDPSVRCMANGAWNVDDAPKCIPVRCYPTAETMDQRIQNGGLSCTRASEFQSRCTLVCDKGYEPDGEYAFTECDTNNRWWPVVAGCRKIQCQPLVLPEHAVRIACTNTNFFESSCFLSRCEPGFMISRPESNLVTCNENRKWIGYETDCTRMPCSESHLSLENGDVLCSNENYYESHCNFYCDTDYELSSTLDQTTCQASGQWSNAKPECIPRRSCSSTYFTLGTLNCDDNDTCHLFCNNGTELVGNDVSNCVQTENDSVQWSPPFGACTKQSCSALVAPANGNISCSSDFFFKSTCHFVCNQRYNLLGYDTSICEANGEWSHEVPICDDVTCDASYLSIEDGVATATDSNKSGSNVMFDCLDESLELIGALEVTCLPTGVWNGSKPTCRTRRCQPINLPNGAVQCDRRIHNEVGSTCQYQCDDLYQLQGESSTVCGVNGKWSNPRPYCRGHCNVDFANFENGFASCTDANWHNSQCSFRCGVQGSIQQPFQLFGSSELTCMENGNWSEPPPCCARPCPPSARIDLFFVLHTSENISYENWTTVLSFVNQIVSTFVVGEDELQVGVVRYNRDVDDREEIEIGEHRNVSVLRNTISFYPNGGYGSNTGRVLNHLRDVSFRSLNNRPDARDYVILITDERSEDDVRGPARLLKETGAQIFTVGIGGFNETRTDLERIASAPSLVYMTENGFDGLTASLVDRVTAGMCDNPCLLSENYRQQARAYIPSTDF